MLMGGIRAGSVYPRCGCRQGPAGKWRGASCPRLGHPGHGSWFFSLDLPRVPGGGRRRVRRGGYPTRQAAEQALDRLRVPGGEAVTVADWLVTWLETRARVRDSTRRACAAHIRLHLAPQLGSVLLAELHAGHLERAFTALLGKQGMSAATARRVHATLRSALNAAVRERLLPDNPARYLKLPRGARPHAVVWTRRRVKRWLRTGSRPAVAVWTPAQAAAFLAAAESHRLYGLWRLLAVAGLRRGEACGLRWSDIDWAARAVHVRGQLQDTGRGQLVFGPPKTEASYRTVRLDKATLAALRVRRHVPGALDGGSVGYVFTAPGGGPVSPSWLTREFRRLASGLGLPPVRLHDLRHGAASYALAAGTDLKVIADQLGHASIVLTADTYLSVTAELGLASATATARLIRTAGRRPPGGGQPRRPSAKPLVVLTA